MTTEASLSEEAIREAVTVLLDHAAAILQGMRFCLVGTAAAVIH